MNQHSVILWDLENTLYPFSPAFGPAVRQAIVKTIADLQLDITPAQAWDMAQPTFPLQTIQKLERLTPYSRRELFLRFHDNLEANFIAPDPALTHELTHCTAKHALITHSSRKFAARALDRLGVGHLFPEHVRITAEDMGGVGKNEAAKPILIALQRLNAHLRDAVMVDDRDENLRHAKALGLATILVGNRGEELDSLYCDAFFPTAGSFLRQYNAGQVFTSTPQPSPAHLHVCKP